jgi:hypothetical protein
VNKHTKLWVKNAFDEWRLFCGFDTLKFIVDVFKDEGLIKDLVDIFYFLLQVAKKDDNLYPPTRYTSLPFFKCLTTRKVVFCDLIYD